MNVHVCKLAQYDKSIVLSNSSGRGDNNVKLFIAGATISQIREI